VYSNFKQYSDKQDNCIDIEEYVIARKGEKPDESQKLILLRYEFFRENGQDALKVTGLYFIQVTHQLNVEGFQADSWDVKGVVLGVS
jgi:hypothetical protein